MFCCHPCRSYTEKYLILFRFFFFYYVENNHLKVEKRSLIVEVRNGEIYIIETGKSRRKQKFRWISVFRHSKKSNFPNFFFKNHYYFLCSLACESGFLKWEDIEQVGEGLKLLQFKRSSDFIWNRVDISKFIVTVISPVWLFYGSFTIKKGTMWII